MSKKRKQLVSLRGKSYRVTGSIRLGAKTYWLLDGPLNRDRTRFRVFDRYAGPRGGLRALHVVPRSRAGHEYVRIVERLTESNVNLPRLIEYHVVKDSIYLVLDWIHGHILAKYLQTCRAGTRVEPSVAEAFQLFRGLAHGLRQMHHKKNFVHGDICPANLVLTREPNRLVLIDFGSAWRVENTRQRPGSDGRSEFYAAPEQLRNRAFVDFRSDQFSVTVVLYELLTLELPYQGLGGKAGIDDHHASCMRGSLVKPSRLSCERKRVPKRIWSRIDSLVERGLALDADNRYASAQAWLADIDDIHIAFRSQSPWAGVLLELFCR